MRFSYLVEDGGLLASGRWVVQGNLDATNRIADVNEGPGLTTSTVHGQRVTNGGLHQEPVQHGAVVTVVVKAVNESLVEGGLRSLGSPHDSLVQVGDTNLVVGRIESEHQLVHRLGQVIHRTGVSGVQDLAVQQTFFGRHLHGEIALRNWCGAGPTVTVDTHGAEVHELNVETRSDDGHEHVVGAANVVVNRVALGRSITHGVRRGALLTKVNNGVGTFGHNELCEEVVVLG
ncbi:unannotated protein [freshwater metagenome]|uniref:Unannotated protein n=1 Tax=freshwater metagenome TaxID=449393 RepID=A0A6J7DD78_9ZZZZ